MLTHTYHIPTQTLDKNQWSYAITRLRAHFMCGLLSDLVICKIIWKRMVIHDTECAYWDQVSLNNANQTSFSLPPSPPLPPPPPNPLGWWSEHVNPYIPTQTHDKNQWPYAITRLRAHCMYGLVSDLVICKIIWKRMVIHDTECPYWNQVSLNNSLPSPHCFL